MRWFWLLSLGLWSCAASVSETEHRAALAAQSADYETRMQRFDDRSRSLEDELAASQKRWKKTREGLLDRIHALEDALAQKGRSLEPRSGRGRAGSGSRAPWPKSMGAALRAAGDCCDGVLSPSEFTLPADELFQRGTPYLRSDRSELIAQLAKALAIDAKPRVAIAVHTDDIEANGRDTWALSLAQGEALLRAILAHGVDPSRLSIEASGQFRPRASNDTEQGRAQNRRVVLSLSP